MLRRNLDDEAGRKRFGRRRRAWINIEIAEDGRQAFLREIFLGGDTSLGKEDIRQAMTDHYRITSGIDEDMLDRVTEQVTKAPNKIYSGRGSVVIARETPPEPSRDGQVHFKFLDSVGENIHLPYRELKAAFEEKRPEDVIQPDLRVRAVAPHDELAVVTPPIQGNPGQDIFGKITSLASGIPKNARLQAGRHVHVREGRFVSEVYGYVYIIYDEISVLPPIWVSPDGFEAHFIHFPQVGSKCFPEATWLRQILELNGVDQGLPSQSVQDLRRHIAERGEEKAHFLLVRGTAPVPGEDSHLDCRFDPRLHTGQILSDGRVDIAARKAAINVESGQLVAEIRPPGKGQPGLNLRGEEIPASEGRMCTVKTGENIHVEYGGDYPRFFYARFQGNIRYDGTTLDVHPVLRIDGDVDMSTGHVDAPYDVEIGGSVRAGMWVHANGNVLIEGEVEQEASVRAKGDVVVARGIRGGSTRIVALGNVETRFIRESSVVARRNIFVGEYIFESYVRTGGELLVQSGGNDPYSGGIVGGEVYGTTGLEVGFIGSPEKAQTRVGIGPDLEIEARMKKLNEHIELCNSNILRIFRALNIEDINPALIQSILRRTPPGRKKAIADLLVKLKGLVDNKGQAINDRRRLQVERDRLLRNAEIRVRTRVHPNAQICIGEDTLVVKQEMGRPVFHLSSQGVNWRTGSAGGD